MSNVGRVSNDSVIISPSRPNCIIIDNVSVGRKVRFLATVFINFYPDVVIKLSPNRKSTIACPLSKTEPKRLRRLRVRVHSSETTAGGVITWDWHNSYAVLCLTILGSA